jgi:hypothetical protein
MSAVSVNWRVTAIVGLLHEMLILYFNKVSGEVYDG